MAGDWIKVEKITPEKPEIVRMAAILKRDSDEIFGKIFRIWAWADDQSTDGCSMQISEDFIDRKTGKKGFSKAMRAVGWLAGEDGALTFPGFARHNGETAKTRAETNRRVANHRERNAGIVTNVTVKPLQKPLPEKRREESNTPLPPFGGESERTDGLISNIQNLGRGWAATGHLTKRERRSLRGNEAIFELFSMSDWETQREFLAARLPDGTAYFQPRLLEKFLSDGGCLPHARDWKNKQRPKLEVVKSPGITEERTEEDYAALAEFLKRPEPLRMNS